MGFLRVVEVFPPLFQYSSDRNDRIDLEAGLERFLRDARIVREHADVLLVADVKNPDLLKFSTLEAAALLKQRLKTEAAPVIVARDCNRLQFLSSILTACSIKLGYLMLVWGDPYPRTAKASNVRDFQTLAAAIRAASLVTARAGGSTKLLGPVDIERLATRQGVSQAKARLEEGAEYLLAQPPTCDPTTFERHSRLLKEAGVEQRVLLNVFPFRGAADVRECERYFGWRLPETLHRAAKEGAETLVRFERDVIERLRADGFPGVYLNARGTPEVVGRLLS